MADEIDDGGEGGVDKRSLVIALRGGIQLDGLANAQTLRVQPGHDGS